MTEDPGFSRTRLAVLGPSTHTGTNDRSSVPGIVRMVVERTCGREARDQDRLEIDLGFDRDRLIELRTALELALQIEFFKSDLFGVATVFDVITAVQRKMEAGAHPPHRTIQ